MDNTTRPVYVIDGSRTPFLRARARPGPFDAVDLAVAAGRPLLVQRYDDSSYMSGQVLHPNGGEVING